MYFYVSRLNPCQFFNDYSKRAVPRPAPGPSRSSSRAALDEHEGRAEALARARLQVNFSPDIGWSTLVQWDNATDSAQFQTRLRWIVKPGREFFVVVGQNLDTKPGDIRVRETQPTAKVRWTFRF